VEVVGDEDAGRRGPPAEPLEIVGQLRPRPRVERAERLVEEQELRLDDERPGQADPLRLAGRELAGMPVAQVSDPQPLEPAVDPPARLRRVDPSEPEAGRDVVEDGRGEEERRRQDEAEAAPVDQVVGRPERDAGERERPVGRTRRARARRSVLLPAPFGPTTASVSPARMSSSSTARMRRPPPSTTSPRTSRRTSPGGTVEPGRRGGRVGAAAIRRAARAAAPRSGRR
jgi:hypothetical protein